MAGFDPGLTPQLTLDPLGHIKVRRNKDVRQKAWILALTVQLEGSVTVMLDSIL